MEPVKILDPSTNFSGPLLSQMGGITPITPFPDDLLEICAKLFCCKFYVLKYFSFQIFCGKTRLEVIEGERGEAGATCVAGGLSFKCEKEYYS